MKSIKKKLTLSKETIINLDLDSMDNLRGGTISDASRASRCPYWCGDTSDTCALTPACPY
jgi:natural product precursor